jgi:hypothetical protein
MKSPTELKLCHVYRYKSTSSGNNSFDFTFVTMEKLDNTRWKIMYIEGDRYAYDGQQTPSQTEYGKIMTIEHSECILNITKKRKEKPLYKQAIQFAKLMAL